MALKRCNMCDRTFTKLEHLKRHERSHTKERPYECPTCNKCFSRSDVLFRHCKGHAQVALTRNNNSEDRNQQGNAGSMEDIHDPHPAVSRTEADQDLAPTLQTREPVGTSPSARIQGSSVPQNDRGHQIDALINAAQHLEPSWQPSAPTLLARTDDYQLAGSHHMGLSPPIDPAINPISYPPAGNVPGLDQWTFDLVHSNHQTLSRTPTDSLQSWLFPQNGSLQIQDGSHHMELDGVLNDDVLSRPPNAQTSPSGSTASIVSRIPCERFARVANCWPSRVWRPSRLMPSLWQSLASCKRANILSGIPPGPSRRTIDKNSTWRLDEQHRSALQDALNLTFQHNTAPPNTREQTMSMDFQRNSGTDLDRAQFPPAEILDIALEMYLNYFHPTLPLIHIPTFSVHNTSQPLLLSMCLIGLSILGTTGAVKFVTNTFPAVLHLVISELRSLSSSHRPPHQQMRVIATSLLALNLASITGRRNRIAQAEQLYIELLTISQNQGLFTVEEGSNAGALLNAQKGDEEKWATWTSFECAKRIIYGLIEADCWWAGYLSTSPIIRSEDVRVFPTAPENLYQAESFTKWLSLIDRGAQIHTPAITPFLGPNPDARLGTASSVWNLLILISLRMYEYNDRLSIATADSNQLEPWRIYDEDQRSRDIVSLVVGLSSTSDVLRSTDLNSVVLWHASCMKMGANMQCFELAAGRGGAEPAASALEDISSWSQTPSARRSILHAAQIFRILSDRKVSDIIHPHSVVALFQAALVLGLYIFTLPFDNTSDHYIELTDPWDWLSMGRLGLAERAHSSAIGENPDVAKQFIANGGPFSLSGARLEGGYLPARKTLLHCADLMEGMGRWKSTTFSQILHIMSDDLTDDDSIDHSRDR